MLVMDLIRISVSLIICRAKPSKILVNDRFFMGLHIDTDLALSPLHVLSAIAFLMKSWYLNAGYRFGEILDGRYEVTAAHGKGVFSTVVRAKNLKAGNGEPEEVAIKMIRSNDTM